MKRYGEIYIMIKSDNKATPKADEINAEKKTKQTLRKTLQKLLKCKTFFLK
jgi:hypothetical protein